MLPISRQQWEQVWHDQTCVSAASFIITISISIGSHGWVVTDSYPAVITSPLLALLLLCVLAQQGTHLLLVIEWTGTET